MQISKKDWNNYIKMLSQLNDTAGQMMRDYIEKNGLENTESIIDYAYGLVTKYGEGSAALAAEMYDETARLFGKVLPPAEVADTASYGEVKNAIDTVTRHSLNSKSYGNTVSRFVKRAGADTTLKNAERDGAEFAWVPSGDSCPLCITIASRGFQHIGKKTLRHGHAEHIHSNCDCTYTVRFDDSSGVAGYDPDEYLKMYEDADGKSSKAKINAMRRMRYQDPKVRDKINAQKRAAYANNKKVIASISTIAEAKDIPNAAVRAQVMRDAINREVPVYAADLRAVFNKIVPEADYYDVCIHGAPNFVEYEHTYKLDAETMSWIISGRRDYKGDDIRLLSCSTGIKDKDGSCFAQELANKLKVKVKAPIDKLNIDPIHGTLTVGREMIPFDDACEVFEPK